MAVAVSSVQVAFSSTSFNGLTTWAPTFTSIPAGSTIVVMFSVANASRTITSVVANGTSNTTLTKDTDHSYATFASRMASLHGTLAADCTSITVTMSGTVSNVRAYMTVIVVTGLAASPYDVSSFADFAAATSMDSGSATPSLADALVIGHIQGSSSAAYIQPSGASWISAGYDTTADDNGRSDYKVVSSTSSVSYVPTNATAEDGIVGIVVYKGVSGSPTRYQHVMFL